MKKVIMSIIGLAIALALVLAIWVPVSNTGKNMGTRTLDRSGTVETQISAVASPIPAR